MKKRLLWCGVSLFSALFILSAWKILSWYLDGLQSRNEFDAVIELLENYTQAEGISGMADNSEELPILAKYRAVYEANSDFVGWVSIEDTQINYPVMQTPDDPEFYLKRNFEKQSRDSGVPFMQSDCDLFTSDNLIIYGHSMKNGSMFTNLKKYKNASFYSEHRFIRFDTKYSYGLYEIVAVFATTADDNGFPFSDFVNAESEADFEEYIKTCKELTPYEIEAEAHYGDRLLTLATCEYSQKNGRMVVVAKLVE